MMVVLEICSVEITLLKEINSLNYLTSFSVFFLKSVPRFPPRIC